MENKQQKGILVDLTELYTVRLVLLLEKQPLSNNYRQILLNPKQFKHISDAIYSAHHGISNTGLPINMEVDDIVIKLPENISSIKRK